MTAESESTPPASPRAGPSWRRWLVPLVLMGALTAVLFVVRGEPLQELTPERLEQARQTWRRAGPDSYRLTVLLQGRQSGRYEVRVEGGEVTEALRDGQPLPQRRTRSTWSVDGMFDTLRTDIEMQQRARRGDSGAPSLKLRAVLDPQYGFPRRYLRTEMVRQGANPEAGWQVESFVVLEGAGAGAPAGRPVGTP